MTHRMDWIIRDGEKMRHKTAKKAVADYLNKDFKIYKPTPVFFFPEDFYIVWFSKTLQNWKCLISTNRVDDEIYFEVTYNGDKDELYLDHYEKVANKPIKMNPTSGAPNVE